MDIKTYNDGVRNGILSLYTELSYCIEDGLTLDRLTELRDKLLKIAIAHNVHFSPGETL